MRSIGFRVIFAALSISAAAQGSVFAQKFSGSAVAASVNGDTITVDDWIGRLQSMRFEDFVFSVNPLRAKPSSAGQLALESLVNSKLVLQYAAKVSLLPRNADIDAEMETLKKQPNITAALQNNLVTEATLREDIKIRHALFNIATVNERISKEEVGLYYASRQDQYGQPEKWTIAVIRVSTKAAVEKVDAELKAGKAFADLVTQYSEDLDSKKRGGELGTFAAGDPGMPTFIRDAVAKLKVGETTHALQSILGGPVPTYFFLRLLAKKEKFQVPLEQVLPQVERAALFDKVGSGTKKIAELRKDAAIVVSLPGYQDHFKK